MNSSRREIIVEIVYTSNKLLCPKTQELCGIYDHAPQRKWRHLDTMQYKTYLCCRLPRVKNSTGKVVTMTPPWASRHERYSFMFENAVIDLLKATKNQSKTAELLGCGFNVINRIIHGSTRRGLERRNTTGQEFDHLSIDEKSFKKGHHYISVLSHPESGCVLDVAEGRTKQSVEHLLEAVLPPINKNGSKPSAWICGKPTYRHAARSCPMHRLFMIGFIW